jgi:hypothetical protein
MLTNGDGRGVILFAAAVAISCAASCAGMQMEGRPTRARTARSDDPWLLGDRCTTNTPAEPALHTEIVAAGIGEPVDSGATVRVHYIATLAKGGAVLRDSHDGAPSEIIIGSTKTICGFERALVGMRPGEERRVVVPSTLAFGENGRSPGIPPGADIVFDIELYLPADVVTEQHSKPTGPGGAGGGGRRR